MGLLVMRSFCCSNVSSCFRLTHDLKFFFETEKNLQHMVAVVDGNFTIWPTVSLSISISVLALRHGNAFSHFCLQLLLAVLRLL